jgi:hypothetical protein
MINYINMISTHYVIYEYIGIVRDGMVRTHSIRFTNDNSSSKLVLLSSVSQKDI